MNVQPAPPPVDEAVRIAALEKSAQLFARESSRRAATDQLLKSHFNRYWNRAYEQGAIDGFLEANERQQAQITDLCHALRLLCGAVPEGMASDNPVLKTALTISRLLLGGDACEDKDEHAGDPAFTVGKRVLEPDGERESLKEDGTKEAL